MSQTLYDTDFYAWTQVQAALLRSRAWDQLDSARLAEEIEDLGASQRHAVMRHLRVLLLHLLKWEYQPERRSESWTRRMSCAQAEIESYLWENPGLEPQVPQLVARAYLQACRLAARETGLPPETFPTTCPYQPGQLLDTEWLPLTRGGRPAVPPDEVHVTIPSPSHPEERP
jgi:Domain of unknown function DUF29